MRRVELTPPNHICFLNRVQNLHLRFQAALVRLILKANHQPATVFWGKKNIYIYIFSVLAAAGGGCGEQGEEILKY